MNYTHQISFIPYQFQHLYCPYFLTVLCEMTFEVYPFSVNSKLFLNQNPAFWSYYYSYIVTEWQMNVLVTYVKMADLMNCVLHAKSVPSSVYLLIDKAILSNRSIRRKSRVWSLDLLSREYYCISDKIINHPVLVSHYEIINPNTSIQ